MKPKTCQTGQRQQPVGLLLAASDGEPRVWVWGEGLGWSAPASDPILNRASSSFCGMASVWPGDGRNAIPGVWLKDSPLPFYGCLLGQRMGTQETDCSKWWIWEWLDSGGFKCPLMVWNFFLREDSNLRRVERNDMINTRGLQKRLRKNKP